MYFLQLGATHWFIGNDQILSNKEFPIVFDSVNGVCKQPENSTSFYNKEEADEVINWIKKLMDTNRTKMKVSQQDIGIISPYYHQSELIREELDNNGYSDIATGSAEVFQGQERPIIIISTVRTDSNDLGFVTDPQVK